jgi:tetratricopeptide (TPR) repeat protein
MKRAALQVFALCALVRPVWAAEDLMTSQLVDQARHWQQRNRDDIAAEIWRSLLRGDPEHGEALVKLGLIEARASNQQAAKKLFEQAIHLRPRPLGLTELAAALSMDKTGNRNTLVPPSKKVPQKPGQRSISENSKTIQKATISQPTAPDILLLKP